MSAWRTAMCDRPRSASRVRASASMSRDASTPTPSSIRDASRSSSPPVPQPISSSRPMRGGSAASVAASIAAAGRPSARSSSQSAPCRRKAVRRRARAFGRQPRRGPAVGRQQRVVLRQAGQHLARQVGILCQLEPGIRPFGRAHQQPSLDQQLQVARQARLGLTQDRHEVRDAPGAARAQRKQAQAGRLGGGAEFGEQRVHCGAGHSHKDILMSSTSWPGRSTPASP